MTTQLPISSSNLGVQYKITTQQLFTCSKSMTETLEKGLNMFKINNKDTRTSLTIK